MRILTMTDPQTSSRITPQIASRLSFAHSAFSGSIGVGREDITPPIGIYARNWGAAEHEVAEGLHHPLTLTAITFQQLTPHQQSAAQLHSEQQQPAGNEQVNDTRPLVLISADLGWWRTGADEWFVRSAVLEAFGLDPARLMFSLTHTHAGPAICREDADKQGGELIARYLEHLRAAAIRAVRIALANSRAALLTWEYGKCALAQNRDLPDPNSERVLCGYNPAGNADDTLLIGRVTAVENGPSNKQSTEHQGEYNRERANSQPDEKNGAETLATLVNYACHPVTLAFDNRLISPDFVGAMRELIEAHTGGAPCLFLQGASGELAPREQYHADTSLTDRQGRSLGYAAVGVLAGMLPPAIGIEYSGVVESGAPLGIWKRVPAAISTTLEARQCSVELPLKPLPSVAEIDAMLADCTDRALAERLRRKRRVRQTVGEGETAPIPLWVWRIGDSILCGHPNEAYSLLQTEVRERFPEHAIGVMNVVNGHIGYLPPAELYDLDVYPVWQTPFERGCLERTSGYAVSEIQALLSDTK